MRTTPRPALSAAPLAAIALAATASAQPRRAAQPSCAVTHHTLASLDGDAVDATQAPLAAFANGGALVAWRTRAGALRLAAFDASWRPLGPARELSTEAGAFALAEGPAGAAVLYVERVREVVLARVNARGEAQNVPRLLHRAEGPLREVALTRTDAGWLALWRDDLRQATALPLEPRGVPRGAGVALGVGRHLRARWLPAQGVVALVQDGVYGDEPGLVSVTNAGEAAARLRWPAATAGPFELPDGLSAAQVTAAGIPVLVRVPPGGATLAAPDGAVRTRFSLAAAAPDGAGVTVVYHDADAGRTLAARAGDPSPPAVVRVGAAVPVGVAAAPDGAVVVTHREAAAHGGARIVATRVVCRR